MIADEMAAVIDRWRERALRTSGHRRHQIGDKSVEWWFSLENASTAELMQALASDASLVTPGDPSSSLLLTQFLAVDRRMARRLGNDVQVILDVCPVRDYFALCAEQIGERGNTDPVPRP